MRGNVTEVGELDGHAADLAGQLTQFLMRALEEVFEKPELADDFERRGMHGVAAEIAQEVAVLFQHDDVDPGARHEQAVHHAGGPAADDGELGADAGRHGPPYHHDHREKENEAEPAALGTRRAFGVV